MTKIKKGYYIKARIIQDSAIATAPPHVREIWDWILKEANHKETKYSGFTVKRGQLFRTYRDIREGLHWMVGYRKMMYSESQTKRAMKFLRENGMIDTTKELRGVLITVLNYNKYQDPKNYESTNESTSEDTNDEPMTNQPRPTNNKNEKNVKNEKNELGEKIFSPPTPKEKMLNFVESVKNEDENFFELLKALEQKGVSIDTAKVEIKEFVSYWTELNSTGKKQRWQMQKTFEVNRRLATWFKKNNQWNKNSGGGLGIV